MSMNGSDGYGSLAVIPHSYWVEATRHWTIKEWRRMDYLTLFLLESPRNQLWNIVNTIVSAPQIFLARSSRVTMITSLILRVSWSRIKIDTRFLTGPFLIMKV